MMGTETRRNGGSLGYLADSKSELPVKAASRAWRLNGTSCCLIFGERMVMVPEGLKIWKNLSMRVSSGNCDRVRLRRSRGGIRVSSRERTAAEAVSSNDSSTWSRRLRAVMVEDDRERDQDERESCSVPESEPDAKRHQSTLSMYPLPRMVWISFFERPRSILFRR